MTQDAIHGRQRPSRAAVVACALVGLAGCVDAWPGDELRVATTWSRNDRARIASLWNQPIRWIVLDPDDDPARLARSSSAPDVFLGGPVSAFEAMDRVGLLDATTRAGSVAVRPSEPGSSPPSARRTRLDLLLGALDGEERWEAGYARLVREEGQGETSGEGERRREEGAAVLAGSTRLDRARSFLEALAAAGLVGRSERRSASAGESVALLEDLLEATLLDSRAELQAAWTTLERAGRPERAERWMLEPPPWPPASVGRILEREEDAMPLVETLAAQVAPDAQARAWLLRSWLAPPRVVDPAWLEELARAAEGRLAREPRFRGWLRGEWRAWARQRYRRVARLSEHEAQRGEATLP